MIRKPSQSLDLLIPKQPQKKTAAQLIFKDKKIQLPILQGTYGTNLIDIRNLLAKTGLMTFDPGFGNTANCASNITYVDGQIGKILYRGYNIQNIAQKSNLMEAYYLLFYGFLPSQSQLKKFEQVVVGEMMINQKLIEFYKGFKTQANPMAIMVGVVGALSAFIHSDYDLFNIDDRQQIAIKLIAKMPTLAAYAYRTSMGLPFVNPKKKYSYMQNFLYMMFANPMDDKFQISEQIIKIMQQIWICHADHEQGPSTLTVRIAASSLADPFACIAAAIGSLWGPTHGGADCAVFQMFQQFISKDLDVSQIIEKSKSKDQHFRLMGFGHRIYKTFDPRAKIVKGLTQRVIKMMDFQEDSHQKQLFNLAMKIQLQALKDEYFIKRKLFPNVDFYTGIAYYSLGIPKQMFTVCFAVSRSVGWMAHWCQMMNQNLNRISRPRQLYVGSKPKEYQKIQDRQQPEQSKLINIKKLNKLTGLMKL